MDLTRDILQLPPIELQDGRPGLLLKGPNAEYPQVWIEIRGLLRQQVRVNEICLMQAAQLELIN